MPVSMTTKKNSHSGSKTASQNSSRDGSSHGGMLLFKEFNKSPSKEETSPKSTTSAVEDLERQVAEMHKFINSNGLATALEAHMGALPPKESPTSTLDGAVDLTPATDTALAGKWCYRSSSRHSLTAAASPVPARREMGCSLPASYSFTAPFDGIDKTDVRPQFPTFAKKLDELYPGAMPYDEAVVAISALLRQHGFTETNSIALISACRDESMKSFTTALDLLWGETFNISSLAGILTCGKTGFGAAMHHSPVDENGLERYVVFTGPHIAISADGEVGKMARVGRSKVSSACGALLGFQAELANGRVVVAPDPTDMEQTHLKQMLLSRLKYGTAPSLAELTQLTHDSTVDAVRDTLKAVADPAASQHAVVSGILIHGPDGSHFWWPGVIETSTAEGDQKAHLLAASRDDYTGEMLRYLQARVDQGGLVCQECGTTMTPRVWKRQLG